MSDPTPLPPETYTGAVVALDLPCRQCGYDLRGLRIDQRCPECAFMVWSSIVDAVDPAASRLPQLRNPRRVGDALLLLMLVIFLAFLLVTAGPLAAAAVDAGVIVRGLPLALAHPGLGGILLVFGILVLRRLAPPRGKEPRGAVRRDLRLAATGLVLTGLALMQFLRPSLFETWFGISPRLVAAASIYIAFAGAFVLLGGLHGILTIIGQRSREYRSSRSGRQGVRALMAALGVVVVGRVLGDVTENPNLTMMATTLRWSGSLMLGIGLAYLVMNAWWIRRSLRQAPPSLAAILRMPHVRPVDG